MVFSPAHIEEIFNNKLHYNKNDGFIKDKLNYLSKITNDLCLLPYRQPNKTIIKNMGVFLYQEHPSETYLRVSKNEGADNKVSENNEKCKLENAKQNVSELGLKPVMQNNKNPKDFLDKYRSELIFELNKFVVLKFIEISSSYNLKGFENYLPNYPMEKLDFNYLNCFFSSI